MTTRLFFDFDMTLGYRILMWRASVRELLLEENIVVDEDTIKPFTLENGYPWNFPQLSHKQFLRGKGWWQNTQDFIVEGLLECGACDAETARRVAERFPKRYADARYWRVFPDTVATLAKLQQHYTLCILSNHVPEARQIVTQLGLSPYFKHMIISAEVGYEKPNKNIYQLAKNLYPTGDKCIMIGDNYRCDIEGATECGFDAILVRTKNNANWRNYCPDFSTLAQTIKELDDETR